MKKNPALTRIELTMIKSAAILAGGYLDHSGDEEVGETRPLHLSVIVSAPIIP